MTEQSREDGCRKIVQDKQLLALPFAQVIAIDTYLKEEWGIKLPSDPRNFEKELLKAAGGKLRKDYNTLNEKQADYLESEEAIPPALEQKFYDLIADEISDIVVEDDEDFEEDEDEEDDEDFDDE